MVEIETDDKLQGVDVEEWCEQRQEGIQEAA